MSCTCLARREARCFPGGLKALPELFQSSGGQDAGLLSRLRANVPSLSLLLAFFSTFQVRKLGYSRSKTRSDRCGSPPPSGIESQPLGIENQPLSVEFSWFSLPSGWFSIPSGWLSIPSRWFSIPSGWLNSERLVFNSERNKG